VEEIIQSSANNENTGLLDARQPTNDENGPQDTSTILPMPMDVLEWNTDKISQLEPNSEKSYLKQDNRP